MPLWGNNNVSKVIQGKNETLYFQAWIESKIYYAEHLKLTGNKLDMQFLYNKLKNKTNILIEANLMQKALSKYIRYMKDQNPVTQAHLDRQITETKHDSAFYYHNMQKLSPEATSHLQQ